MMTALTVTVQRTILLHRLGRGMCSLTAGLFAFGVTRRLLPLSESRLRRLTLAAAHVAAAGNVIFIGDPVNVLLMLPFFFAAFVWGTEGALLARLSVAAVQYTLFVSLNGVFNNGFWDLLPLFDAGTVWLEELSRPLAWVLIWAAVRRTVHRPVDPLSPRLWAMLDALSAMPFLTTLTVIVLGEFRYDYADERIMLVLQLVLLHAAALAVGLLLMLAFLSRHEQLEKERTLWQAQGLYYRSLEQSQAQVRRLRHDMANHLQVLAGLSDGAARKYVAELLDSPAIRAPGAVCENRVVSAVVSAKMALMEDAGITPHLSLEVPAQLPLTDVDLCALFANALDNAIEACRHLPLQRRELTLRARCEQGLLVMQCVNPCEKPPERKKGLFVSQKPDAARHGFGLQSIRQAAERYGGTMSADYEEGRFMLLVSVRV